MKRFIIHTLTVKPKAKIQFQIKLPSNIKGVKAIKVTHPFYSLTSSVAYPISSDNEIGWLWLRLPDLRDVFYSEILRPESYAVFQGGTKAIFSLRPNWYLNGSKHGFLSMDIPANNTVIYGFYWDKKRPVRPSSLPSEPYQIKIYLKLC